MRRYRNKWALGDKQNKFLFVISSSVYFIVTKLISFKYLYFAAREKILFITAVMLG